MSATAGSPRKQGILPFVIALRPDEQTTARAGLPLVVEALRAVRLDEVVRDKLCAVQRRRDFTALDKIEALVLLIASGGDRVEDIRILSDDKGLLRLLGGSLPSPDALLDFLSAFDDPELWKARPEDEASFVPEDSAALYALDEVLVQSVARIADPQAHVATIDHDGTIIESHKQSAKVAYEGTRGFQPLLAVWVEQDLIVTDEFRDGNVPGGKDPLSSVRCAFEALPQHVTERYFRGDTAAYYEPLLKYLVKEGIQFAIGADMSESLRMHCEALPEIQWSWFDLRDREEVHIADVEFTPGNWPKEAEPLRYVALRFTPRQAELFSSRPRRFLAVVSNRKNLSMIELMRWYFGKAGTIEHVHRVLKDELGAGVLPSQRYGANAAWLRINCLVFNLLTLLRRRALPARFRRARPKRLRFECFTLPARLSIHQRQITLGVSAGEERTAELIAARIALRDLRAAPATPAPATPAPEAGSTARTN